MKHLRTILQSAIVAALLLGMAGCGMSKNTKAAEAAVERFHRHWNANEFQAVFDDAHMQFRAAETPDRLKTALKNVKQHYGDLKSSSKRSWGFNTDKGITDIKLSYDSSYTHGNAVEEFIYRMSGDHALLLAYDIMSPEDAAKRDKERKAARDEKREADKTKRDARKAEKK